VVLKAKPSILTAVLLNKVIKTEFPSAGLTEAGWCPTACNLAANIATEKLTAALPPMPDARRTTMVPQLTISTRFPKRRDKRSAEIGLLEESAARTASG
jgi:hypothetical protein